ncbi:MAG: DNA polymerase epsilon subunit 2 [Streblomastix strix]|uniref:DNA polymerase II subunit 2 n=1 Tax=Streblomastix strix TaxID=222440 RepID=A0A5J4W9A7_9EUKA|nr:MAG: DNA polymerase epsilon subunit 2 [Streblomastix strix]
MIIPGVVRDKKEHFEISPINSLLGDANHKHYLFGMLTELEEGCIYLEDLSGAVKLDFSRSSAQNSQSDFFCEGSFAILYGQLVASNQITTRIGERIFAVDDIHAPPSETSQRTLMEHPELKGWWRLKGKNNNNSDKERERQQSGIERIISPKSRPMNQKSDYFSPRQREKLNERERDNSNNSYSDSLFGFSLNKRRGGETLAQIKKRLEYKWGLNTNVNTIVNTNMNTNVNVSGKDKKKSNNSNQSGIGGVNEEIEAPKPLDFLDEQKLREFRLQSVSNFVVLSEIFLDIPEVLQNLEILLSGYEQNAINAIIESGQIQNENQENENEINVGEEGIKIIKDFSSSQSSTSSQSQSQYLISSIQSSIPLLFIMMGSFTSSPAIQHPDDHEHLRRHWAQFAEIVSRHEHIRQRSTFLFIPGPNDPTSIPSVLPLFPYMDEYMKPLDAARIKYVLGTNPTRIQVFDQKMIVFRSDVTAKLRKWKFRMKTQKEWSPIQSPQTDRIQQSSSTPSSHKQSLIDISKNSQMSAIGTSLSTQITNPYNNTPGNIHQSQQSQFEEWGNLAESINTQQQMVYQEINIQQISPNRFTNQMNQKEQQAYVAQMMKERELLTSQQVLRTLVDQGTLSPLPLNLQPVFWNYGHALDLFPLPDHIVIGDNWAMTELKVEDSKYANTGSFTSTSHFFAFDISSCEWDSSSIRDTQAVEINEEIEKSQGMMDKERNEDEQNDGKDKEKEFDNKDQDQQDGQKNGNAAQSLEWGSWRANQNEEQDEFEDDGGARMIIDAEDSEDNEEQ